MSPTPELLRRIDTPQMVEEVQDEDEDEGSSESHSEYETHSEFEPESSEDDFELPTAQRKYALKARGEVLKTSRAISSRMNVKNDSESGLESTSVSSEDDLATQPPPRMDLPQAEKVATESENLQAGGNHPKPDQESSKPTRKTCGGRQPGAGRKRIYDRDENGKPIRFNADGSRKAPKQKYTYINRIPRRNKQKQDRS
ncbi:hypothetical protein E8E11_002741 [Didymella keratinophila]|nr:hypothetical protein E8E11_002741 [Didymella keratinophila]